jgi:Tfp pilus assembly protein PilX
MMTSQTKQQRGAVSLFVVIFAALLIITVVTAFMRIMIQDQMQATASDLSRSAYDSAQTGVEDVKRAVAEYMEDCPDASTSGPRCSALSSALGVGSGGWTNGCDVTAKAGVARLTAGEVLVRTNTNDTQLDQAYTCVKVNMQPGDVIGDKIYPLRPEGDNKVRSVEIDWSYQNNNRTFNLSNTAPDVIPDTWLDDNPSILRVQLIQYQYEDGFSINSFDANNQRTDSEIYNRTLFFVPSRSALDITEQFSNDERPNDEVEGQSGAVRPGKCANVKAGNYACKAKIELPAIDDNKTRYAYLRVDRLYTSADNGAPRVIMKDGDGIALKFDRVQVAVDVTGRANDIFKRIRTRLDIGGANVPLMAVDSTKSLCKEYAVTDNEAVFPSGKSAVDCPDLPTN